MKNILICHFIYKYGTFDTMQPIPEQCTVYTV